VLILNIILWIFIYYLFSSNSISLGSSGGSEIFDVLNAFVEVPVMLE